MIAITFFIFLYQVVLFDAPLGICNYAFRLCTDSIYLLMFFEFIIIVATSTHLTSH